MTENEDLKKSALESEFKNAIDEYNKSFENSDYLNSTIEMCREIIKNFPSAAEPYFLLGLIAFRLGDEGQAISMCETAHKLEPDIREYAEALSVIMVGIGKLADGLYFAKLLPSLEPHSYLGSMMPGQLKDLQNAFETARPSSHYIEAMRLFNLADYNRVIKECSAEVRINPNNFDAYILFARTMIILGKFHQAESALHAAIQIDPASALARAILSRALVHIGHFEEAVAVAEHAISMDPVEPEVYAQAMSALLSCPNYDVMRAKGIAEKFQADFDKEFEPEPPEASEDIQDRPPHIGFLSNTFFSNEHSELFSTWFSGKRTDSVQYLGYQQSILNDSISTSLQSTCDQWREVYDVDPYTLSYTIKADYLDVIVDLSCTDWESRMDVVGLTPCPVRVGAFSLPEPGFAPGITHILCDDVLINADDNILLPNQKKVHVAGSLFARQPYTILRGDIPSPVEKKGYVTFGGKLDLARLSPECANLWADVLHAVPQSRLMLCGAETANDNIKQKALSYFSHAGIIDRIDLPLPPEDGAETAMEIAEARISNLQWEEIDIFLDTAPFNCRAELCEALWTGTPTISLKSSRRNGLIGASILTAAKRMNWVASTPAEFTKLATSLALDIEKLGSERQRLQKNIAKTSLFSPKDLAVQIQKSLSALT